MDLHLGVAAGFGGLSFQDLVYALWHRLLYAYEFRMVKAAVSAVVLVGHAHLAKAGVLRPRLRHK